MARKAYGLYSVEDRRVSSRLFRLRLRQGVWERPSKERCDACSQDVGPIEWHREDYSLIEPEGLVTICYLCHRILHMRDRMPEGWDFYRLVIRMGGRYRWTKHIGTAASIMHNQIDPTLKMRNQPRERTILDDIHDNVLLVDTVDVRRARMDAMYEEYAQALLDEEAEQQLAFPA